MPLSATSPRMPMIPPALPGSGASKSRTLTPAQLDALVRREGPRLTLRPGETLELHMSSREKFTSLKGLAKNGPFTVSVSKDVPTSRIVIAVKPDARPGRVDTLTLETRRRTAAGMVPELETRFRLEVGRLGTAAR